MQLRLQKQDTSNPSPNIPLFQGNSSIVPVMDDDYQHFSSVPGAAGNGVGVYQQQNPLNQNINSLNLNLNLNFAANNMGNKSFVSSASKSFRPMKSYVRQPNFWFGLRSVPEASIYIQATTSSDQKLAIHGIYMSVQEDFHSDSITNFESFYQLDDILTSLNLNEFSDPRIKLILKKLYSKVNSINTEEKVQKEYIDTQIELFTASHRDRLIGSSGSAGAQSKSASITDSKSSYKNNGIPNGKTLPPKSQTQSLMKLRSLLHQTPFVTNIDEWEFDVNQLKFVEEKYTTSWNILRRSEFFETFVIPEEVYANFIKEMQKGYDQNNNPFHNFNHGISVMQSCYMLSKCKKSLQVLKNIDIFTLILSGLCHDVGHTGRTNNFEIASSSKLALRYHDKSVLEQHHLATTFEIIKKQDLDCNILQNLDIQTYNGIRRAMISNILYTDIKQHFKLKQDFETYWKTIDFSTQNIDKIQEGELDLLTGMIIHTADFTGAAKPFVLSRQWSEKVNKEFHCQYIEEGQKGIEQTAFMKDLDVLPVMAKAEKGFLNVIVLPLWVSLNDVFQGELQGQITNLNDSIQQWGELSQLPNPPKEILIVPKDIPVLDNEPKINLTRSISSSSSSSHSEQVQEEEESICILHRVQKDDKQILNQSNGIILELDQEESNEKLVVQPSNEQI